MIKGGKVALVARINRVVPLPHNLVKLASTLVYQNKVSVKISRSLKTCQNPIKGAGELRHSFF